MAEKKYWWLKLKEDFFEDKTTKFLRKLPDGDKLVISYLKMQLKSLKTDGVIHYDRLFPNSYEEIAMIIDEEPQIVQLTIKALLSCGAVEELEDGSLYMAVIQDLIGSEGSSTQRVREFRKKQKTLQCNTHVTKMLRRDRYRERDRYRDR